MTDNTDKPWLFAKGDDRASEAGKKGTRAGVKNGESRSKMSLKAKMESLGFDPADAFIDRGIYLKNKLKETGRLSQDEWDEYKKVSRELMNYMYKKEGTKITKDEPKPVDDETGITKDSALDDIYQDIVQNEHAEGDEVVLRT
ncbi:hypothetical protein [Vibrio mediterranei]|uniref:hypothetical protein n=1 Tax=Vibrio mediterranei TaxID=689 RepID=UPI0022837962|nr:hypothetical protein [Vibrio mediterranei]MCY9853994.1 hypothetical protein [Vibrio mediterranei]